MHVPSAEPRDSVFYTYRIHPYCRTPDMDSGVASAPVVIVGAGPIGLVTALELARFGVPSIVLEQDLRVAHGSRAIVLTRRSLEILQQAGVDAPFRRKGLPWSLGRSFYRGKEIYRMVMPHDEDDRFMPGLNIQQQYIEEYLVDFCSNNPLVDLRWGQKVVGIAQTEGAAALRIDTPDGEYGMSADWVIAADGGRSAIRKLLGLRLEGRSYAGTFVIADIKAKMDLPTERLCHFDPAWNPGNNVLIHRQPDDMWRIDFRLPDEETPEQALLPATLTQRINAVLSMLGQKTEWRLDWATVYSASTLTLPDFVHGRVLFTGDAAHLLPIFGVQGCNTGLQDCNNMAWKLAFVVRGWSHPALLDTYSSERVQAARDICEEAGKSTRFMTPPTRGGRLMRDAVLSFCLSEDFLKDLLHWRTSRPHNYQLSALNSYPEANAAFADGLACGQPARNVKLGDDDYLFDRFDAGAAFHVLIFARAAILSADIEQILLESGRQPFPVIRFLIGPRLGGAETARADLVIEDADGRIARKYGAHEGTVYVLRPDLHVCARWRKSSAREVCRALRIAACTSAAPAPELATGCPSH
jgi:3-(3-hydroxy-phenyl)propionate hydroxylase